jgi:hypothetical protein
VQHTQQLWLLRVLVSLLSRLCGGVCCKVARICVPLCMYLFGSFMDREPLHTCICGRAQHCSRIFFALYGRTRGNRRVLAAPAVHIATNVATVVASVVRMKHHHAPGKGGALVVWAVWRICRRRCVV